MREAPGRWGTGPGWCARRTWQWWRLGQLEVRRESGRGTPEIERAQDARAREQKAARERQNSRRELTTRIVTRYGHAMENFIFSISTVSHTPDVGAQQNRDKQRVAWLIETRRVTTERKRGQSARSNWVREND